MPVLGRDRSGVLPCRVRLAPWAENVARSLHDEFGADVDLTVGFLHFPDRTPPHLSPGLRRPLRVVDPNRIGVSLARDLSVSSGHTVRGDLRVENHTGSRIEIRTNGQVTASVVDPATGSVVGGFAGAQALPLVVYTVQPGDQGTVPVLVGTASLVPDVGYAVPAGEWQIEAVLDLGGEKWRTPRLPLTVT